MEKENNREGADTLCPSVSHRTFSMDKNCVKQCAQNYVRLFYLLQTLNLFGYMTRNTYICSSLPLHGEGKNESSIKKNMTPKERRNEMLAGKIIKQLARRNMKGYYCPTAQDAIRQVTELIPDGSQVSWGGSMTIRDMGLVKALHEKGTYDLLDRDLAQDRTEAAAIYMKAFQADYYLSSANALSEDGVIVNIDGTGNRVAAITFGPRHVIFVIGINKVCQDADAALKRARSTASPINTARFDIQTPCRLDGVCHNCCSDDCICNYIHFLRHSPKGRHQVVIVGEDWGY